MAKDIEATPEEESESTKQNGMSPLQIMLMVVTGSFFLMNGMVMLSHAAGPDTDHNRAVHNAVDEFKMGMSASIAKKARAKDSFGAKVDANVLEDIKKVDVDTNVRKSNPPPSKIARLSCEKYGGPSDEFSQEMVYWSDVPSDARYVSPFRQKQQRIGARRQYMTFEPDGGGWNNIRMAMETVVGLAIATGRTLVLPPQKKMYLLGKGHGKQKTHFDFDDFFPMHQMAEENDALEMITMKEFLETEAMTGQLKDKETGNPSFPPNNRTDWNGINQQEYDILREWLRTVAMVPLWKPGQCLAAFPANGSHKTVQELQQIHKTIHEQGANSDIYKGHPVAVDSEPLERMKENLAGRKELCIYDEAMQSEMVVHFECNHKMKLRLLVHFYAFLFMEDWREDLWMKRFMRDHMRYKDEIQCAAARVVKAMRKIARDRDPTGNPDGHFDSFHIRRGDFQFKQTRIEASEIYKNSKDQLKPNTTIFIATDERDKKP